VGFGTAELSEAPLYLYGFFYHMLTTPNAEFKPLKMKSHTVRGLKKEVVVVLDEFPALNETNSQMIRLLRNVVRALRFKLVVMGTNSTAASLVDLNEQSRGDDSFDWCYIFPRLPKFNLDAITIAVNSNQNLIKDILSASRPLFSQLAVNIIEDFISGHFDSAIAKIANKAIDLKKIFENKYGLHGQVCLFFNVSYPEYSKVDMKIVPHSTSSLIHRHFAHLEENRLIKLSSALKTDTGRWKPRSRFPTPSEDFLLSACLMGSKEFYPFEVDDLKVSFHKAADLLKNSVDTRLCSLTHKMLFRSQMMECLWKLFWQALLLSHHV
jgi:hypothetical protein